MISAIIRTALLLAGGAMAATAQTNIFPSTGAAGVGTTAPARKFEVVVTDLTDGYNGEAVRASYATLSAGLGVEGSGSYWGAGIFHNGVKRLTLDGNGGAMLGSTFVNYDAPADGLSVEGRVGIGVQSPEHQLHIGGDALVKSGFQFLTSYNNSAAYNGSFGWNHLQLGNNGGNYIIGGRTTPGGSLIFVVNNTLNFRHGAAVHNGIEAMTIAGGGNVGIGTVAPSYLAHVYGPGASGPQFVVESPNGGAKAGIWVINGTNARMGSFNNVPLEIYVNNSEKMRIDQAGNVGIGTTNPTQKLSVNGTIRAREVVVETVGWADHVFDEGYNLKPLSDVENHIKRHKRLPGIPSAADVAEQGIGLGEMQAKLLAKIEELTLHQIEHSKRQAAQEKRIQEQSDRIATLEKENATLRTQRP